MYYYSLNVDKDPAKKHSLLLHKKKSKKNKGLIINNKFSRVVTSLSFTYLEE